MKMCRHKISMKRLIANFIDFITFAAFRRLICEGLSFWLNFPKEKLIPFIDHELLKIINRINYKRKIFKRLIFIECKNFENKKKFCNCSSGEVSINCFSINDVSDLKRIKWRNFKETTFYLNKITTNLEKKLHTAINRCPKEIEAALRNNLGVMYEEKGDRKWAEIMFNKAQTICPENETILKNLSCFEIKNKSIIRSDEKFALKAKWSLINLLTAGFVLSIIIYFGFYSFHFSSVLNSDEIMDTRYWVSVKDIIYVEEKIPPENAVKDAELKIKHAIEKERNKYVFEKHLQRLMHTRVKYMLPKEIEHHYVDLAIKSKRKFDLIEKYYKDWDMEKEKEIFNWSYQDLFENQLMRYLDYPPTSLKLLLKDLRTYFLIEREWCKIYGVDVASISQPITIAESNVKEDVMGELHSKDSGIRQINLDSAYSLDKEEMGNKLLMLMITPPQTSKKGSSVPFSPEFAFRPVFTDLETNEVYTWKDVILNLSSTQNSNKFNKLLVDLISQPINNFAIGTFHIAIEKKHPFFNIYKNALRNIPSEKIADSFKDHKYDELRILYVGYMGGPRAIKIWFDTVYRNDTNAHAKYNKLSSEQLYKSGMMGFFINKQLDRVIKVAKKVEFLHKPRFIFFKRGKNHHGEEVDLIVDCIDEESFKYKYKMFYKSIKNKLHKKHIIFLGNIEDGLKVAYLGDGYFSLTENFYKKLESL